MLFQIHFRIRSYNIYDFLFYVKLNINRNRHSRFFYFFPSILYLFVIRIPHPPSILSPSVSSTHEESDDVAEVNWIFI